MQGSSAGSVAEMFTLPFIENLSSGPAYVLSPVFQTELQTI